jgi:hypothetical protein
MPRRGIVNVRMVITEEKILSNIEKVQRLINPNSKKQIIELDDNSYFKDLVESIKTYLIEYPKKKNFPKSVYDAAYELVEYATNQFEENTKQREYNIKSATILKQTLAIVQTQDDEWKKSVNEVSDRFSAEIIEALNVIGKSKNDNTEAYQEAEKLVNARIANLESNLHIEIDMERVEDRSKALSYIGIEIADALKLIPTPVAEEPKVEEVAEQAKVEEAKPQTNNVKVANTNVVPTQPVQNKTQAYENFYSETRTEVKSSLWNKFKNSKFVRAVKYALKIRVVLQLPEALPEGNSDGMRK